MKKTEKHVETSINPDLASKIDAIRQLFDQRTHTEAHTMYRVGVEVAAIKADEQKYGKGSVKVLARALGCTAANLYGYATVAKAWTSEEFEGHLTRVNGKSKPLTFSHFVEVAKIPHRREREELLNRALNESLSVREIATAGRVRAADTKRDLPSRSNPDAEASLVAVAIGAHQYAERVIEQLEQILGGGDTQTPDEIRTSLETLENTQALYSLAIAELQELDAKRSAQDVEAAE